MDGGPAPGAALDEFDMLKPLARGGFSVVYRARHRASGRESAIKKYLPAGLRGFANEARILSSVDHPHVVKLQRCWRANGTAYLAMPLVAGPTLRQVRESMKEAPTEPWLRSVLSPLLDALAALHRQGIYHRDIAPDNVLLPDTRGPVLIDFGAAWQVGACTSQPPAPVVRHGHAPIEQYGSGEAVGPWTDLYALGALVVYLLTAEPPPRATQRMEGDRFEQCSLPGMSPMLLAAVRWALAVRPEDRPQDVHAFRQALQLPAPTASYSHRVFVPLADATPARLRPFATGSLDCHVAALLATRGRHSEWLRPAQATTFVD